MTRAQNTNPNLIAASTQNRTFYQIELRPVFELLTSKRLSRRLFLLLFAQWSVTHISCRWYETSTLLLSDIGEKFAVVDTVIIIVAYFVS